ncbi:acyl-CoA reductase [Marinicrinis sediminis]|uniref:Acyl-CoA reductase n=1 Tax=Marinicrinis sediminis TaxID=1652465 RepID=A0ABW5RBK6_9BACL
MVNAIHFIEGRTQQEQPLSDEEFKQRLQHFGQQPRQVRHLKFNDMVEAFYTLYQRLASPKHPVHRQLRHVGLAYLLTFIHPDSLRSFLKRGLRHEQVLDQVVDLTGMSVTAVPRGMIGHWMAGNVPLLSLISVIQAILTKNHSIVKLSSRQIDYISPFLAELSKCGQAGQVMSESVMVVSYPGKDTIWNQQVAAQCDVRVAWGGREAVHAVSSLPGKPESETLIFGPKYSCAVIDPAQMDTADWTRIAQDMLLFNQLACSSPHALIVKGDKQVSLDAGGRLAEALQKPLRSHVSQPFDAGETMKVVHYRTRAWLKGERLLVSEGAEWTLHFHDRLEPLTGEGLHILHVYPSKDMSEIGHVLPPSIQTISHKLEEEDMLRLLDSVRFQGVSRIVPVGKAHHYQLPWDGMLVLDRFVRWITVEKG